MGFWDAIGLGRKRTGDGAGGASTVQFEMLEPRLLLNADLPVTELSPALLDRPVDEAIVVDLVPQEETVRAELVTVSDGAEQSEGRGAEGLILETAEEEQEPPVERVSCDSVVLATVSLWVPEDSQLPYSSDDADSDVASSSVSEGPSAAQQLVATLHAANGPPEDQTTPADVTLESAGLLATVSAAGSEQFVIGQGDTLSGQPVIEQDVYVYGRLSPGNSPGIVTITGNLIFNGTDPDVIDDTYGPSGGSDTVGTLVIEIGGDAAGSGYDQVNVSGTVALGGILEIALINDFEPSLGDTFDFLTFTSRSGRFTEVRGPMGFGAGTLYFEVVEQADRLRLVVAEIPTGMDLHTTTSASDRMIQATSDLADQAAQRLRDLLLGTPELTGAIIPGTGATLDELFDLSDYLNVAPAWTNTWSRSRPWADGTTSTSKLSWLTCGPTGSTICWGAKLMT